MAQIRGGIAHNFISGTEEIMVVWKNGVIHRNTGGWFNGPGIALTNDTDAFMSSYLDKVLLTNGTDSNWNYDGSFWTTLGITYGSPIAKFNKPHTARLFLYNIKINGTSYPSRAWFSDLPGTSTLTWGLEVGNDLVQTADDNTVTSAGGAFKTKNIKVGDPLFITSGVNTGQYTVQALGDSSGNNKNTTIQLTETLVSSATGSSFWVGSNWFDVQTDDGDIGMGMGITSNEVFLFKKGSVYRYNVAGTTLRKVKNAVGTTSSRSIVEDDDYVYWYHPSGIYRTTGDSGQLISNAVEDLIENVSSANQSLVVGWVNKLDGTINFYLGDTTTRDGDSVTNCVISFDTNAQVWSIRSYDRAIKVTIPWLKSSVPEVYFGGANDDVYQIDTGTSFNGSDIPFITDTKVLFPAGGDAVINFDRLRTYVENGPDVQFYYKLYYRPGKDFTWYHDTDWRPLIGSQKAERVEWEFPPDTRASGIKIRAVESSQDESFTIEKYILYYSNISNY